MWVIAQSGGLVNLNTYSFLAVTNRSKNDGHRFQVVAYTPQRNYAIIAACENARQGYAIIRELATRLTSDARVVDVRPITQAIIGAEPAEGPFETEEVDATSDNPLEEKPS